MKDLIINTDNFLMCDTRLAKALGLQNAIMLQQVGTRTHNIMRVEKTYPEDQRKHYRDGRWWVWNSYPEWVQVMGDYCSTDTVKRSILALEELGLIISTDEYNEYGPDRTKWYAIDYEKGSQFLALWYEMGAPKRNGKQMSQDYKEFYETWLEVLAGGATGQYDQSNWSISPDHQVNKSRPIRSISPDPSGQYDQTNTIESHRVPKESNIDSTPDRFAHRGTPKFSNSSRPQLDLPEPPPRPKGPSKGIPMDELSRRRNAASTQSVTLIQESIS